MDVNSGSKRPSEIIKKSLMAEELLRSDLTRLKNIGSTDYPKAIITYKIVDGNFIVQSMNDHASFILHLENKEISQRELSVLLPHFTENGIVNSLNGLHNSEQDSQLTLITSEVLGNRTNYWFNTLLKLTVDTIVHIIEDFEDKTGTERELFNHASLMMNNPNPVLAADEKGEIIIYNPSAYKLLGKELNDLSVFDLISSLTPEEYSSINSKKKYSVEARVNNNTYLFSIIRDTFSDRYFIYATNVSKLHETLEVQSVLFEITSASHTTEKLIDLYKKIQDIVGKIIDTRNFFIALYDKNTDTISLPYFIDEMDSFSNIPAGRTLTAYVIKNNASLLLTENDILKMAKDGDIDLVGTLCKKWLGVPLKADGEVIGAIITQNYEEESAIDQRHLKILEFISNEIASAIELKKAESSIRSSEQLFRSLIEQTSDAIFVMQDDNIVLVNPAWIKLFGYSFEEATAKSFTFYDLIIPEHRAVFERTRSLQRKLKTGKIDYDLIAESKDGQKIDVEIYLSQINYMGKEAFQGICRDITKRKKDLEKINKYNEELKILNASKDKFFSLIAHDLKSPFNALIGYSDFIQAEFNDLTREEIYEGNIHINKAAKNIYMLLENLLQWSGLQTGGISYQPANFLLYNLGKKVVELYQKNAESKNIELVLQFDKFAEIYADENMIYTVLRNLVSNAIKFTGNGGKVILSTIITEGQTQFSVKDNGLGISEEDYEKLFRLDLSHSTRGTNNEKGTGLGLLLCKELIQKNGGTLSVSTEKDAGSTFTISLPAPSQL